VKRLAITAMLLISIAGGVMFAQQELGLLGRYDDARYLKQSTNDTNQIVFTRLIYNGRIPGYYKNWYTDYPDAGIKLILGLKRLTNLNIADEERAIAINDPDLFRYPFVYTSEPEQMVLTDEDAATMREYLNRGGFWILDDLTPATEDDVRARYEKAASPILGRAGTDVVEAMIDTLEEQEEVGVLGALLAAR